RVPAAAGLHRRAPLRQSRQAGGGLPREVPPPEAAGAAAAATEGGAAGGEPRAPDRRVSPGRRDGGATGTERPDRRIRPTAGGPRPGPPSDRGPPPPAGRRSEPAAPPT